MENKSLLFYLILFMSLSTSAQTLIPRVGLTYSKSTLSSDDTPYHYTSVDTRQGFLAGIGFDIPVSDRFSFLPEVLYIEKGEISQHIGRGFGIYNEGRNYLLRYIEFPLQLKFNLEKPSIYFTAGVYAAIGIGGKVKFNVYHDNGIDPPYGYTFTEKVMYKDRASSAYLDSRFDMGLQAGAGVLLFNKVIVDVRYCLGLADVEYYNNAMGRNRVLQLSVGVPLAIGEKGN